MVCWEKRRPEPKGGRIGGSYMKKYLSLLLACVLALALLRWC